PNDPSTPPTPADQHDDEQRRQQRQQAVDSIAAELAAIDESAVDRARADMEAAIDRFVTASTVYNRILAEIRQQLREIGDVAEEDVNYRSESGRSGLRVNDVVRFQTLPWQTVSHVALTALRTHAPVERVSLDSPRDSHLDDQPPPPTGEPEARDEPEVVAAEDVIDQERIEELFEEMISPVLAFVRDQQAEITRLLARIDRHADDIVSLREQIQRQTEAAERVTAYFDALREAQSRLQ
ncbi:MAG TPA: hypothetical protein VMM78_15815, partial [Thermomicrobiales bacterium]|nr:hypothetical protein [Thermomicrobiales bacterium]